LLSLLSSVSSSRFLFLYSFGHDCIFFSFSLPSPFPGVFLTTFGCIHPIPRLEPDQLHSRRLSLELIHKRSAMFLTMGKGETMELLQTRPHAKYRVYERISETKKPMKKRGTRRRRSSIAASSSRILSLFVPSETVSLSDDVLNAV
jgi:hypothetical protein